MNKLNLLCAYSLLTTSFSLLFNLAIINAQTTIYSDDVAYSLYNGNLDVATVPPTIAPFAAPRAAPLKPALR